MRDEQLLADLESVHDKDIELYRQHGISTYTELFAVLKNENADDNLRLEICFSILYLHKVIDKRRAIPALLVALRPSNADNIRDGAARGLGALRSRRAVPLLVEIAADKTQSQLLRIDAIIGLDSIDDQHITRALLAIAQDEDDVLEVRTVAIEHLFLVPYDRILQDYITWLRHPISDIRFWAAFGLTNLSDKLDISPALPVLDRVVAFDHTFPTHWGWHVDREAISALEGIYFHPFDPNDKDCYINHVQSHLISPAAEYMTFVLRYRRWTGTWEYTTKEVPAASLKIEPSWLENKLKEQWDNVLINVRKPRLQAYLLDWEIEIDGTRLIGGLQRDAYAVVVTGNDESVLPFAAWYRGIIPANQPLFLYEWAGPGLELRPGMTVEEIKAEQALVGEKHNAEAKALASQE